MNHEREKRGSDVMGVGIEQERERERGKGRGGCDFDPSTTASVQWYRCRPVVHVQARARALAATHLALTWSQSP